MSNVINEANWKFHWRLTESAGIMIYLAEYRGRRVLWEGSLPYVTVDHQRDALEPTSDGTETRGPWWVPLGTRTLAGNVRVQPFRGGVELSADFTAGPYHYQQMWRFHDDGRLSPWLTIYGSGLHDQHTYHPHWRFDFDLDGAGHDALESFTDGRWQRVEEEGWFPHTGEADEQGFVWRQIDFGSNCAVHLRPHSWDDAELFAVRYHDGEWAPFSPRSAAGSAPFPAAYIGREPLDDQDVAIWYVAHVHFDQSFPYTAGPWIKLDGFYTGEVGDHVLIQTLALVVGTAAITTVLFQRLRLPVVLGYLVAGLLVGPHTSLWFVADAHLVETLAELGVILLMFSIGLELSIRGVVGVGVGAIATAVIEVGLMVVLGSAVGRGFGLDGGASLFVGAIVAISSTTIISRSFDEHPPPAEQKRRVFGLLVVEDLLAILLLTVLTAVSRGGDAGVGQLATTVGKLLGFLAATIIGGLLVIPRLVRATERLGRRETTLVLAIGVCFGLAILADAAGYSVALGAFLAGALVAEAGANETIEPMIEPIRDLFAAIFFVSVGMLIDPIAIRDEWLAIVVILAVVVGGKIITVSLGVFLSGRGIPAAIATGMAMAQIGELSFVAASIGVGAKVLPPSWYAVAVAVSAVTTALTPLLVRSGPGAAAWVERVLPRRLQTFEALYGSWIEGLGARTSPRRPGPRSFGPRVRRLVALLAVDSLLLLGVVLATGLFQAAATRQLTRRFTELDPAWADNAVLIAAFALALPLLFGLGRLSRALAVALAEHSLPPREGVDLGLAPRRMLIVALQVPILLVTGLPLLAATGALAPPLALGLLGGLVLYEAWQVWRRAGDLQAHVSAGAQAIVEILAAQGHRAATAPPDEPAPPDELAMLDAVLPGLGTPTAVRVGAQSPLVGRTLGTSNLRGLTGATVLAIQRGARSIPVPAASDTLEIGDVLALAGSTEAIAAATELLTK